MSKNLHLTDQQYLDLLKAVRADLDRMKPGDVEYDDCTMIGNKYTISNVGLCTADDEEGWSRDRHLTRETAMWPEDFDTIGESEYPYPQQFTRKYRKAKHTCPLEIKKKRSMSGCFYRCRLFSKKSRKPRLQEIKKMYDQRIKEVERWFGQEG